jgi:hypothetical protein
MRDEDSELPVSFASGRYDNMSPNPPVCESTVGAGAVGAFTVTFKVDDPHDDGGVAGIQVPPMVLQTMYEMGVAIPEKVTRGTNVTVVPESVQVPWLATSMDVFVQPEEMVSSEAHNFKDDELKATDP